MPQFVNYLFDLTLQQTLILEMSSRRLKCPRLRKQEIRTEIIKPVLASDNDMTSHLESSGNLHD